MWLGLPPLLAFPDFPCLWKPSPAMPQPRPESGPFLGNPERVSRLCGATNGDDIASDFTLRSVGCLRFLQWPYGETKGGGSFRWESKRHPELTHRALIQPSLAPESSLPAIRAKGAWDEEFAIMKDTGTCSLHLSPWAQHSPTPRQGAHTKETLPDLFQIFSPNLHQFLPTSLPSRANLGGAELP